MHGKYDVLAGYETKNYDFDTVTIEKGVYAVFHKKFEGTDDNTRVEAIIETWGKIWEYYADENSQYKRAYRTDFEYYKNQNEIEIYISIK